MKQSSTRWKLAALVLLACATCAAAQDTNYAVRLPCELQNSGDDTGETTLETLTWMQGTTPLIACEPLKDGRPVPADDSTTVRMLIGPSATGTLYAVSTNYLATNHAYFCQWPTIGTNSVDTVSTNGTLDPWWYTVYFEDETGYRYWSGEGDLYIKETTSTAEDGLVWQTIIAGAAEDATARAGVASNTARIVVLEEGGVTEDALARAGVASNAVDIAALETGKLDVATASSTYQPIGDTSLSDAFIAGDFAGTEEITPYRVNASRFGTGAGIDGEWSVAVGYWAGLNSTGSSATAIGARAGYNVGSTSSAWTAIGDHAGEYAVSTTNGRWIAIGNHAAEHCTGEYYIAIGSYPGYQSHLDRSVAVGAMALAYAQTTGTTAIGQYAGQYATGTNQLFIETFSDNPGSGFDATNATIWGNNGALTLGRGGELAEGKTNNLRGAWALNGEPLEMGISEASAQSLVDTAQLADGVPYAIPSAGGVFTLWTSNRWDQTATSFDAVSTMRVTRVGASTNSGIARLELFFGANTVTFETNNILGLDVADMSADTTTNIIALEWQADGSTNVYGTLVR